MEKFDEYHFTDSLDFGKYKGKTILEIMDFDSDYLNWCLIHRERFLFDANFLEYEEVKEKKFSLNKNAQKAYDRKHNEIYKDYIEYQNRNQHLTNEYIENGGSGSSWISEANTFDALTDGQYGNYSDFRRNGGEIDDLKDKIGE